MGVQTRTTVLVVDDDAGVRESVRLVLEPDFDVVDVADGTSALGLLDRRAASAVVLDLLLPDVDGLEVLQSLRTSAPDVPVVVLTAVKTVRTAVMAMKLGAADYLTKPFDETELRASIRRGLEDRMTRGRRAGRLEGTPEPSARIAILSDDIGWRAALDVALQRLATIEVAESWIELRYGNGDPAPAFVVIDGASVTDGIGFPQEFLHRIPRDQIFVCHRGRPVPAQLLSWSRKLSSAATHEAINRIRAVLPGRHPTAAVSTPMSPQIGQALEWLAQRYGDDVTVEAAAGGVGLAPPRFAAAFRAEVGIGFRRYVARLRVEVARVLLATGEDKLSTIAGQVGFFDASHLSRTFVEELGQRPSFYRR